MKRKVFSNEQIIDIVNQYNRGITLKEIAAQYEVSRPTIQAIVKEHLPSYTGKKRKSSAFVTDTTTKRCPVCKRTLLLSEFNKGCCRYGTAGRCRECERMIQNNPKVRERRQQLRALKRLNAEYRQKSYKRDIETRHNNEVSLKKALLRSAKQRAKVKGLDFNITIEDFDLPKVCPLLRIPLTSEYKLASDNSYSLDRKDSSKGYIKGNVWVISRRANAIKNNATIKELETLVKNLKKWIH